MILQWLSSLRTITVMVMVLMVDMTAGVVVVTTTMMVRQVVALRQHESYR